MTTPPDNDPWASDPGRTPQWEQPPGQPPAPPGVPQGGWTSPPPPPGYGGQQPPPGWPQPPPSQWSTTPPPPPHPNWPQQGTPGDWSAPGYGYWGAPKNNGMGTAALVLGILAVLLCWTIVGGLGLGILALIFGLVGRGRVKRREADNGGAALTGVILGSIGAVAALAFIVVGIVIVAQDQKKYEDCLARGIDQAVCEQRYEPVDP